MTVDTAGMFLVATPVIGAPPFSRSVILMLEHDETGAVGIILNATTDIPVAEHLPDVAERVSAPGTVFIGGPVSIETAVILGRSLTGAFLRPAELGDVGLVDHEAIPDDVTDMRVFAGYAGWSPGQLEAEIEEGSWWVLPPRREEIFTADTADLWERLVASAPGTIPFHVTYPPNVSAN